MSEYILRITKLCRRHAREKKRLQRKQAMRDA